MTVLVHQLVGCLPHPVDGLHHMHRDTDGTRLICNGTGDRLTDPPGGIGGEAETTVAVKLLCRLDQTDVALLDQVQERQIVTHMLFGNGHHQTQVCLTEAPAGVKTVPAGLQQLLPPLLGEGTVLHSLHCLFFRCLFLVVLAGLLAAVLVQILVVAAAVLVLLKGETGAVLLDVLRGTVLLAVCLQDVCSLCAGMDAAAQLHLLLCAQQGDLTDLLQVVLHRVIQQLIHCRLQVRRVLLVLIFVLIAGNAQILVAVLGIFHLCHDAFHIQPGLGLFLYDLDAPFLQKCVERVHIHPALCSKRLCLLRGQGAFAFRQQFL